MLKPRLSGFLLLHLIFNFFPAKRLSEILNEHISKHQIQPICIGMKGSHKKGSKPSNASKPQPPVKLSLREEAAGKKQNVNAKSMLQLDHLKNLAVWASSSSEGSIPPLAAFFGQRLAASSEPLGVPPDPSLFSCKRCESILQPGNNCTVRIEKNKPTKHRRNKSSIRPQNNVVYKCHFCLHKNLIRGTPRGYVKQICPPKVKPPSKPDSAKATIEKPAKQEKVTERDTLDTKMDLIVLPDTVGDNNETSSPATPSSKLCTTLLDSKRRKRSRPGSKRTAESERVPVVSDAEKTVGASSKRRRKGWTSLKEIAESSVKVNNRDLANVTIPFFI